MLDRERSILGQAIIKSLLQSSACPREDAGGIGAQKEWIDTLFPYLVAKIEAYAKLDTPLNAPRPHQNDVHLSDEQVARGVAREADKAFPESLETAPLKNVVGLVESTSRKEYKPEKFMYGIKVQGVWHTSFYKLHYNIAEEAKGEGKTVRVLYDPTPYKGKPSRTVQSIDPLSDQTPF